MKSAIPTLLILAVSLIAADPSKELTAEQKMQLLQAKLTLAKTHIEVLESIAPHQHRLTAALTTFANVRAGLLSAIGAVTDGSCDFDNDGKLACKQPDPPPAKKDGQQ